MEISDRDFIKQNRQLSLNSTTSRFQNYLIETFKNYNPDLLFFGHTNNIYHETIDTIRNLNKNIVISQWNEDPIMKSLKDSKANIQKISHYGNIVDHNFITTHPSVFLKQNKNINNLHKMLKDGGMLANIEKRNFKKVKDDFDKYYRNTIIDNSSNKIQYNVNFLSKLVNYFKTIDIENVSEEINKLIKFDRKFEKWDTINKSILLVAISELKNSKSIKYKIILNDYLEIACGDKQSIKVTEIQRQGKRPQNIGEFMLGSQLKKGSKI